jgi:hypothetical protein
MKIYYNFYIISFYADDDVASQIISNEKFFPVDVSSDYR